MKPVSSRATAVATFGFALPRATSFESGTSDGVAPSTRCRRRSSATLLAGYEHLPTDPRHALIRPRGFGEQPPRVRIAGLRDPAAADTRPTRVFRRHEAEKRHELPRMIEASDVADLGDQADGRDKRDAAQAPAARRPRGPAPGGRELPELVGEPFDAAFRFVDRVAVFLQRDVLRRQREAEIREPAPIRARPPGASRIASALPQQERLQPMLRLRAQPTASSRARTRSRSASSSAVGM